MPNPTLPAELSNDTPAGANLVAETFAYVNAFFATDGLDAENLATYTIGPAPLGDEIIGAEHIPNGTIIGRHVRDLECENVAGALVNGVWRANLNADTVDKSDATQIGCLGVATREIDLPPSEPFTTGFKEYNYSFHWTVVDEEFIAQDDFGQASFPDYYQVVVNLDRFLGWTHFWRIDGGDRRIIGAIGERARRLGMPLVYSKGAASFRVRVEGILIDDEDENGPWGSWLPAADGSQPTEARDMKDWSDTIEMTVAVIGLGRRVI